MSKLLVAAVLIGAAAGFTFWIFPDVVGTQAKVSTATSGSTSLALVRSTADAASSAQKPAPALVVEDSTGESNEPLPLGIRVTALTSGATVSLDGLPIGTRLTAGVAAGAGKWRVGVKDLPVTAVIPPRDYAGAMSIAAELHESDGRVTGGKSVQLMWMQTAARTVGAARTLAPDPEAIAKAEAAANAPRKISPAEVAGLIKRGQELATVGDFPAARLLLQRAAEAHEPRAALALAATYDPVVIKHFTVTGAAPDGTLAEAWYQKAREWDSSSAPRQGNALASFAGR